MAFTQNTLCSASGASVAGTCLQTFTYRTTDNLAAVTAANYITNTIAPGITNKLYVGDRILCCQVASTAINAAVTSNFNVYVSAIANGVVTLVQLSV